MDITRRDMATLILLFVSLTATVLFSACGKVNDALDATKDMSNTTKHMASTTDDMDQKTGHMSNKMDGMLNTTEHMSDETDDMDNRMGHLSDETDHVAGSTDQLLAKTDHLSDQTDQLLEQTQELKTLTQQVAALTAALAAISQHTYTDLRQGNSATLRDDSLHKMIQSQKVEAKIALAGIYMQSFEFQLWKDQGTDTQDVLDNLYYQAFLEFFKDQREFQDGSFAVDPTSTTQNMENLYAIVATMQLVNQNAAQQDTRTGKKQVSLYSLIESVLKKKAALDSGKIKWADLKLYEQELLGQGNTKDTIYLLRLRANFFPILVLTKLSNLEYEGFISKINDLLKGIDGDFNDLELGDIYSYDVWIQNANESHDMLASMGLDPQYNWKLARLYSGLKYPDTSKMAEPRKTAMNTFISDIEKFRKNLSK